MKKVFLYKDNTNDRDCCAYIDANPLRWECDHYFGGVILHGACYCNHTFAQYEDIKTVLSKSEYEQLVKFSQDIDALGFCIKKGDERYHKGVELCEKIQPVYDKLLSAENDGLFEEIQQEEREYLKDEYNLDDNDIDEIFNNYYLEYRDRGIVGYVYENIYELGYETAWSCGYIKDDGITSKYFDFEQFGKDLTEEEDYLLLDDGRVVALNY